MDVTPLVKKGQQIIQSYADGGFKVSGVSYQGGVVITPGNTSNWLAPDKIAESLTSEDFRDIGKLSEEIDILIIGTGARHVFLGSELINPLKELKINVEFMDTGAACRTYNVLMTEGRRVAAALLPVLAA